MLFSMLFSIIIPTYNYASFVHRAIQSVLAQQDVQVEIIVIDDGSTDNTSAILKNLSTITYVYQENQGAATARNHGVRLAKGDYVLFLDADDELLPGALAAFQQFISEHPTADMIAAGHTSIAVNGKQRVHRFPTLSTDRMVNFVRYIQRKIRFSNGAMVFKRQVFQTLSFPEYLRSNEDMPVFAQSLALFECLSFPEPVLAVHKHADSLRNQFLINRNVGLQLVDAVFNPVLLPPAFMHWRQAFYGERCLGLFRSLYLAKQYKEARVFYWQAIRAYPACLFSFSYFKKFIFSFFR